MQIIGYVLIAWLGGVIIADSTPTDNAYRITSDRTHGSLTLGGGYQRCRPNRIGGIRLIPWPFRRSSAVYKHGDIDSCSGQVFIKEKWHRGHWRHWSEIHEEKYAALVQRAKFEVDDK